MGAKYTEGQKNATARYMADRTMMRIVVTKTTAERYKQEAKNRGKSLNQFVIDCIEEALKKGTV